MVFLRLNDMTTGILQAGEVGYVIAGIKDINGAPVGDTLTHASSSRNSTIAWI